MPSTEISILRRRQVEALTGLARSTLYELMTRGTFPRPIHLGPRAVGWIAHEVNDWLTARVNQTRSSATTPPSAAVARSRRS